MPLYSYICPDGHQTEMFEHMEDAQTHVSCNICGQSAWRDWGRINFAPPITTGEQESLALAVDPRQIPVYKDDARKHNLRVDFKPDGTAVFPSTKSKERYMKAYGYSYKPHVRNKEL